MQSPVLLLGAGTGEATCGILYLASYLRRHGVEASVRLWDADETEEEVRASLEQLLAHVKPRLVGVSLEWFHHVARARLVAQTVKIDGDARFFRVDGFPYALLYFLNAPDRPVIVAVFELHQDPEKLRGRLRS